MTLNELSVGASATILNVGGSGSLRQHFLDMGVIPGVTLTVAKLAPMGDPMELMIHGYELTMRIEDAKQIEIIQTDSPKKDREHRKYQLADHREHPGYGEDGKYHDKRDERDYGDKLLSFALAGNQNCGKTTLFNQLTGSNQHVGNFPGVTVDRKSGAMRGFDNTSVTDLPGIYSLSPYTAEEIVSRNFILDEKPDCIIDIVDATNIERNLYLTLQLMELEIPLVLAVNMMDELRGNGGSLDINIMEDMLGVPVVPISAIKNEGVKELAEHAVHIARYNEKPGRNDFCSEDHKGGAVHRCIHGIMHLIEDHAKATGIPVRFAATKLVENDSLIASQLNLTENEREMLEHIVLQMEQESGLDRASAIADMRYAFIMALCAQCVEKPSESKEHIRSRKIDAVLTGKYTAIPSFIIIMGLVFYLTFDLIGARLQDLLLKGIDSLTALVDAILTGYGVNATLHSLIIDGIFTGVGTVLSFVPVIAVLFFFLSMLEDSGYMARIAFVTDKLLRKIGLSGRSIVPMLIGFGCTVPGVMASRTLPSKRDRKMTILLTPFMSCTAKLPIYAFITQLFFVEYKAWIILGLYLLGICIGIVTALISKKLVFTGEPVPFVMELPNYRLPAPKNVLHLLWDKSKDFIERAFSVILLASVAVWFLQNFNFRLNLVTDSQTSILATVAGLIAPAFALQGLNDWRIVTSLFAGFIAKESVVSTILVLYGGAAAVLQALTPASAVSMLVFCLLYTPCIAAIAAVRRELGRKWSLTVVVFQCLVAWVVSLVAYGICTLFL